MIVVVVANDTEIQLEIFFDKSDPRNSFVGRLKKIPTSGKPSMFSGLGRYRFGPAKLVNDARSHHNGSVMNLNFALNLLGPFLKSCYLMPCMSTRTVAWPSQVA